jgi:hypothetical protein
VVDFMKNVGRFRDSKQLINAQHQKQLGVKNPRLKKSEPESGSMRRLWRII